MKAFAASPDGTASAGAQCPGCHSREQSTALMADGELLAHSCPGRVRLRRCRQRRLALIASNARDDHRFFWRRDFAPAIRQLADVSLWIPRDLDQTERMQLIQAGQIDPARADHLERIVEDHDTTAALARNLAFDERQQAPSRCSQGAIGWALRSFRCAFRMGLIKALPK